MSHYETLGVKADATPEEVKAAFRRKAMEAHPDRGGSEEGMARVNEAYTVLSDPRMRADYDAGKQFDGVPREQRAEDLFVFVFMTAIERVPETENLVALTLAQLQNNLRQARGAAQAAEKEAKKLARLRKRFTRKSGKPNGVTRMIDARISAAKGLQAGHADSADTLALAIEIAQDYADAGFEPEVVQAAEGYLEAPRRVLPAFRNL